MTDRLYGDEALVLRSYKLGEADRIVVLLTARHGKVRAVAKGVRKTKSRIGGRLELLGLVKVQLRRGSNLDHVDQVESIDSSAALLADLDVCTAAQTAAEAVDLLVPEGEPVADTYRMLLGVRRARLDRPSSLVVPAFLWRLLAAEGLRPELDRCATCGSTDEPLVSLDLRAGGGVCRGCRRGTAVSPAALELLREVLSPGLGAVLDRHHRPGGMALDDPVLNEVARLAVDAFEHHVERRLRSPAAFGADGPGRP
ncbi:MAG: DNA repair protein RecO [Ilumatobacteraceae bacterium]